MEDPFFLENEENYDKNNFKIPFSHEGVARTDRIYLSNDLLQDQFETYTTYIDNPGQNDHCIVTITVNQKTSMEYKENTEEVSDTKTIPMTNEIMEKLEIVIEKLREQDREIENIKGTLKDIKARI